ncbi:MAG: PAS domain-containing sensor histidine kinase [Acidimicrobiales bacterium]|jgi:protein-histidine pros-kinase
MTAQGSPSRHLGQSTTTSATVSGDSACSSEATLHQDVGPHQHASFNEEWAKEASQAFLELAPDAVVIINAEGTMILVNAQTEAMFGYPRRLLVGQPVEMLLPESARGSHIGHRSGYVDQPRIRTMGARLDLFGLRADGTEFPIGISLSPLDTGRGMLFAAAVRDVTERRQAVAKFGSFLEHAPDAVVVIEGDGRIAIVNAQTERLFGYSRSRMIGQPVEMLLPMRFRNSHIAHRSGYEAEPRIRTMGEGFDLFGERADGSEFAIDISLAPLETETGTMFAATVRDVTQRKRLEANREEFIHHAAHELRTPLATLAALSETLASGIKDMTADDIAAALAALRRQGERARMLVANLLDLSQLESGRSDVLLGPVDLGNIVALVLEGAPAPEGKRVTVEFDSTFMVVADPVQLNRILTNLLTNAYRYGGPDINISAEIIERYVIIDVSDDGDGVPDELQERVFDPFVRGKTAGSVGGSGVGLALCRRISDALGGAIWYEANPVGATFRLRLQLAS